MSMINLTINIFTQFLLSFNLGNYLVIIYFILVKVKLSKPF